MLQTSLRPLIGVETTPCIHGGNTLSWFPLASMAGVLTTTNSGTVQVELQTKSTNDYCQKDFRS